MLFFRWFLLSAWACSLAVQAEIPNYRSFPSEGGRLLLWVASERGRAEPVVDAAAQLAERGVAVWSLDPVSAYFLPQLPSSMDAVPTEDMAAWLRSAQGSGQRVAVYAVGRAAVPVLQAVALLQPAERQRLCVLLMHPNLYAVADPLAAPRYLELGDLSGVQVRVLQPRRAAATPWLTGLVAHLEQHGAQVSQRVLEKLREGYWARETPTDFEIAESRRMGAMLLGELNDWGCK